MGLVDFKFDLVVMESIFIEGEVECEGQKSLPNSVKEITSLGIPIETNWSEVISTWFGVKMGSGQDSRYSQSVSKFSVCSRFSRIQGRGSRFLYISIVHGLAGRETGGNVTTANASAKSYTFEIGTTEEYRGVEDVLDEGFY